jgi:hypothetical protein
VGVVQLRATKPTLVRLVFDAEPPAGSTRELRLEASGRDRAFTLRGRTRISAAIQLPRGLSQLLVKTDPPATSEADAVLLTTPRAVAANGDADLLAERLSADPGF